MVEKIVERERFGFKFSLEQSRGADRRGRTILTDQYTKRMSFIMPSSSNILARAKKATTQKIGSDGQSSITGPSSAFASPKGVVTSKTYAREDPNKRCRVDLGSDDEEGTIIPRNICVHSNPSTIERHVEALLSPLDERRLHELGCAASSDDLVSSIYRALSDAIFIRRDRKQLDKENTVLKKSNKVLQEENKKVIEKLNTLQKKIEETDKELVNEKGEISWFVCSAR
ncbi:hypothetical protein CsatB_008358 [Cannabis sativa]|uniref:uncharacterized protein LOC115699181 isoform X1 n=2 Tax=Cannabis sativa TaxID=3483 RepID=UPI0029CA90EC|nr:uncharacterized protein LOC115699181 isoform X1 [Cannabis sativa]XP_030482330.2 uncharacterized protein LOC115699181 isoform X1 [Cannabis sativa]XP_030482338.2 uncharacterized protein LOC115699181 isoform X1 [Cannabis sativa]